METEIFRTIIKIPKTESQISVDDKMIFMGSCFAENMGRYMKDTYFQVSVNPFGVLYNPVSILNSLQSTINNSKINEQDLVFKNELWHSFQHHGKFSSTEPIDTLKKINSTTLKAHTFLQKTDFLIITFGTAYVYQHNESKQIVANCHKFPQEQFDRYLLNTEEIVDEWKELILQLRVFNPAIKFIFTVSPVRHLKDGAHNNQLSKATLLLAIDKLTSLFDKAWYFPAYEVMMDELRDYRFYDAAMTQPNKIATDYIWKRFSETQLNEDTRTYYNEALKIVAAKNHRPLQSGTKSYALFLRKTLENINFLSERYPSTLIKNEALYFQEILNKI